MVGADRIAANGDVANKVGTLAHALAAKHAGVPFVVAAPESTIDLATGSGAEIDIELRDPDEVLALAGHRVAAPASTAWNPAFDVTPADLITAIVTERRVIRGRAATLPVQACAGLDDRVPGPHHPLDEHFLTAVADLSRRGRRASRTARCRPAAR